MKKNEFKEILSKKEQFKKALIEKVNGKKNDDKSVMLPELKVNIIDKNN